MTNSKTFYLVRHGRATYSTHGYGKRKLTAPILPEAAPIMQKLAQSLKDIPDSAHYSSEIIRCRETSAIITAATGKTFIFDKRLNEEYHERIGEIKARVESFLDEVKTNSATNIIICSHGAIIAAIKNLLINKKFVTRMMTDYPQPGELMIIEGMNVKTINFN